MNQISNYFKSSIGRKQIVAITGLMLILFIIGHLAGNLFIFMGPEAFNAYAKKLANLRPGLYLVECGLLVIFLIHVFLTASLVLENIRSRVKYRVSPNKGSRSLVTRVMPYTGTIVFVFVVWHLLDFTFIDKHGPRSIINGIDYGLYGVVFNSFSNLWHSLLYILAISSLGLHLAHGVESFIQTFGFNHPTYTPLVKKFSFWFSTAIVLGFNAIPVYVLLQANSMGY